MVEILALATAIAAVTSGVVQAIKQSKLVRNRFVPIVAIGIGVALGAAAVFVDLDLAERLWAGGISGLAATGLFEVSKNATNKDDDMNG